MKTLGFALLTYLCLPIAHADTILARGRVCALMSANERDCKPGDASVTSDKGIINVSHEQCEAIRAKGQAYYCVKIIHSETRFAATSRNYFPSNWADGEFTIDQAKTDRYKAHEEAVQQHFCGDGKSRSWHSPKRWCNCYNGHYWCD